MTEIRYLYEMGKTFSWTNASFMQAFEILDSFIGEDSHEV